MSERGAKARVFGGSCGNGLGGTANAKAVGRWSVAAPGAGLASQCKTRQGAPRQCAWALKRATAAARVGGAADVGCRWMNGICGPRGESYLNEGWKNLLRDLQVPRTGYKV
jgi:hypothetical protein